MSHNNILRQQLEESHRTNEALTNDLQKLTTDWEHLRDDVIAKEDEWKEEELVNFHWSQFFYIFNFMRCLLNFRHSMNITTRNTIVC